MIPGIGKLLGAVRHLFAKAKPKSLFQSPAASQASGGSKSIVIAGPSKPSASATVKQVVDEPATVNKLSSPLLGVAELLLGFTPVALGSVAMGIVFQKEIRDLFSDAIEEVEGAEAAAVDDQSNASSSVSMELVEDGGTMGVRASAHGDHLRGNSYSNWLAGEGGNDTLIGGDGDDVLEGGAGADVIDGDEGEDFADYSSSDAGVHVDLTAGAASGGHAEGDQLLSIENLIGSDHDDTLRGTDGTNIILGGAGNDVLEGRGGDDVLTGGAGADVLDGGEGLDLADYSESDAGVVIDLPDQVGSGGHAEGDRLFGIDHLVGSDYDDTLIGTDGWNNVLSGGAGNDVIEGRGGDDVLLGGAGADTLNGGEGIDTALYNASEGGVVIDLSAGTGTGGEAEGDQLSGIESVIGSAHGDLLAGDAGTNLLSGGAGDDVLEGRGGDDYLIGGAGADVLNGADGEDLADYGGSSAGVTVDLGSGIGTGGDAEGDRLSGVDHVLGSEFDDVLRGEDGWSNLLVGGEGHDVLDGRGGDDTLIGGAGDDVLTGGEGNDIYVLKGAIGHDVITDFEAGDRIHFSAADEDFLDSYSVLQAAEQVGNDVLIRLDGERSITLSNTQIGSLHHDSFLIAA